MKEMKEMKNMQVVAFLRETPCADRIRKGEYEGGLYNGYVAFPNDAIEWEWPEDDDEVYDGYGYSFYEVVDMHFHVHGGITLASHSFNPYGETIFDFQAGNRAWAYQGLCYLLWLYRG